MLYVCLKFGLVLNSQRLSTLSRFCSPSPSLPLPLPCCKGGGGLPVVPRVPLSDPRSVAIWAQDVVAAPLVLPLGAATSRSLDFWLEHAMARRRKQIMTHIQFVASLKAKPVADGIVLTYQPSRKALMEPSKWERPDGRRLVGPSFRCRTESFWIVDNKISKVNLRGRFRKYFLGCCRHGYKHFPRCLELDDFDSGSCSETQLESSDDEPYSGMPRWPVRPPWPVSIQDVPLLVCELQPFKFKLRPSSSCIVLE